MHTPVLLNKAIEALDIKSGGLYIDATLGEGGHTQLILEKEGKVLGIDQDKNQISNFQFPISNNESRKNNLILVNENFANIEKIAKENKFCPVDGILFDLGLSMKQLTGSGRGFSYKKIEEPLDMRLSEGQEITASDVINNYQEKELYEIFATYSEEIASLAIAKTIYRERRLSPILKVGDLLKVIDQVIGKRNQTVYSRIFQALRITINQEEENLEKALKGSLNILKPKGRIVIITFHSVEDRWVKRFIVKNNLKQLNKKIIKGSWDLSYEKSAKLRIISL